jgi:hypothetical protein
LLERTSPDLEAIVDRYVRRHAFDDETYDPIESAYREAHQDAVEGQHPAAIREIAGRLVSGSAAAAARDADGGGGFGGFLTSATGALQKRAGLSEQAAAWVLAAAFVVAGPSLFLFTGMVIGGMSKRNINRVMRERYGDTYTVDATIKQEETVEAPDDDEDEDDEDDEDEDNDGDDDDDEDDEK